MRIIRSRGRVHEICLGRTSSEPCLGICLLHREGLLLGRPFQCVGCCTESCQANTLVTYTAPLFTLDCTAPLCAAGRCELAADKVWIIGIKQVQRSMGQKLFDAGCQSCSKTRHLRKCSHCKVIACCSLACTDHQKCGMHVLSDLEQYQCPLSCSRALMQSSLALSKSD